MTSGNGPSPQTLPSSLTMRPRPVGFREPRPMSSPQRSARVSSQAKATLHELCRVMGLPGKPNGMSGAEVEKYYRDGYIREIAEYCESDVLNTYRVWLRYELFQGRLSEIDFQASEANLTEFVKVRSNTKPHLTGLM
jgi:3'-5' exonuclease